METDNAAAKTVYDDPRMKMYDDHVKRLLATKIFLAHIMKSCLEEFKEFDAEEIAEKYIEGTPVISDTAVHKDEKSSNETITGMNTEDSSINEKTVRYDILFYAYVPILGETVKFIINIEAQQRFNPGYSLLKRAVYYCSRLISSQYTKEFDDNNYDGIKKVFSIWICSKASADKQNTVTRFSFTESNLIGKARYNPKDYDLMEVIMVCLGGNENDENYTGIIKFLDKLTNSDVKPTELKRFLQDEYKIKLTAEIDREVLGMCNLSMGLVEKTLVNSIKALMESSGFSFDGAFNALMIPKDEYSKYKKLVLE